MVLTPGTTRRWSIVAWHLRHKSLPPPLLLPLLLLQALLPVHALLVVHALLPVHALLVVHALLLLPSLLQLRILALTCPTYLRSQYKNSQPTQKVSTSIPAARLLQLLGCSSSQLQLFCGSSFFCTPKLCEFQIWRSELGPVSYCDDPRLVRRVTTARPLKLDQI
jgi:hypothetical protein